jgi:phage-related protein
VAIALGSIYGDIRLKLDALRLDGESAVGIFTGLQEKLLGLGNAARETGAGMATSMGEATAGVEKLGVAATDAGVKLTEAGVKAKEAAVGVGAVGTRAKESGGWLAGAAKSALGFAGAFVGLSLTMGIISGVGNAIHSMFSEAGQGAEVQAQLNSVLASTSGISGMTIDSLNALSGKLMMLSGVDDELIGSAEKVLLTFTNIHSDVFPAATQAALDLSKRLGGDLQGASMMLGKALNDPIKGMGALRRVGVQLDDQQVKAVKHFMAVGDAASAQKVILQELNKENGGAAEAYGKTLPGKIAIFQQVMNNAKQTIGTFLQEGTGRLLDALIPLASKFADALPAAIQRTRDFLKDLGDKARAVADFLRSDSPAADVVKGALIALGLIIAWVTWSILPPLTINLGFLTAAMGALDAVLAPITLPVLLVAAAIGALVIGLKLAYDHIKPFHDFVDRTREALARLFSQGLSLLQQALAKIVPWLQQAAHWLGDQIGGAVRFAAPYVEKLAGLLRTFASEIQERLGPALPTIKAIGAVLLAVFFPIIPIIALVVSHWKEIMAFLMPALLALRALWVAVWPYLSGILVGAWNIIVGVVKVAWALVSGIIKIGLDLLGGQWGKAWGDLGGMLHGVWDGILQILRGALGVVANLLGGLATVWGGLLLRLGSFLLGIVSAAFQAILNAVLAPFRAIGAAFVWLYDHNTYIKALVDAIVGNFRDLLRVAQFVWNAIVGTIRATLQEAWAVVSAVGAAIWGVLSALWNTILTTAKRTWSEFVAAIRAVVGLVSGAVDAVKHAVIDPILGIGQMLFDAGKNLMKMLADGIKAAAGGVWDAAKGVVSGIGGFLGFHSPTKQGPGREADRWMPNLMRMLASGIDEHTPLVAGAAGRAAAALQAGVYGLGAGSLGLAGGQLAAGPLGGGGVHHHHTTNVEVHVEVQPDDASEGGPDEVGLAFGTGAGGGIGAVLAQYGYHKVRK